MEEPNQIENLTPVEPAQGSSKKLIIILASVLVPLLLAGGVFVVLHTETWNPEWNPFMDKTLEKEMAETMTKKTEKDSVDAMKDAKIYSSKKLATIIDEYSQYIGGNDIYFSPGGTQVAYRGSEGSRPQGNFRVFFILGDEVQKKYDFVSESMFFLPDGKGIAYIANEADKSFLVSGGEEGKKYPKIEEWNLVASPDRKLFAYSVRGDDKKEFVVINEEEQKKYDKVKQLSIVFSPDGKNIAYIAGQSGKEFVVLNGKEGRQYDEVYGVVFSPDSQHVAYGASENDKWFVVRDEKESVKHDYISLTHRYRISFSPDSQNLVYIASTGDYWGGDSYIMLNDEKIEAVDSVEKGPVFSPDGNSIAYIARGKSPEGANEMYLVLGGKEQKKHYWIWTEPVFSPDGKRVAYVAGEDEINTRLIVVDNVGGKHYDSVLIQQLPVFSSDSKKIAYIAIEYDGHGDEYDVSAFVVVDGTERKKFDFIWNPVFSKDGKYITYGARKGNELLWVVDGLE